jgi:hypothetical protein
MDSYSFAFTNCHPFTQRDDDLGVARTRDEVSLRTHRLDERDETGKAALRVEADILGSHAENDFSPGVSRRRMFERR